MHHMTSSTDTPFAETQVVVAGGGLIGLTLALALDQASIETIVVDVGTEGEILEDVFIIREIGHESVLIGFVGYDSSEDTRVPLAED